MAAQKIKMLVRDSVCRTIIMIDEKNLNVFVRDYADNIRKRHDCFGYIAAFIATTLALITANFHDKFLSATVWEAIFIVCDFYLFWMVLKTLYLAWKKPALTPDQFIEKIKMFSEIKENEVVSTTEFK